MNRLEVANLTKKYGEKYALRSFSFTISDGEIVGLLGRKDAGKTTLLRCIAGGSSPDSGELVLNGRNLLNSTDERKDIGVLIETGFIDCLSAYDNQVLVDASDSTRRSSCKRNRKNSFSAVKLKSLRRKLVGDLSADKLNLAQTLSGGLKILLLDEPFEGLDAYSRRSAKEKIKSIVAEYNIGVLFSEHTLDGVRDICGRIICIENGQKVYDGIMSDETIYYISLDKMLPGMTQQFAGFGANIDEANNVIQVIGNANLTSVLKQIAGLANVLKIERTQDPLSIFLKQDD